LLTFCAALTGLGNHALFCAVTQGHPRTDFIAGAITSHAMARFRVQHACADAGGFDGHEKRSPKYKWQRATKLPAIKSSFARSNQGEELMLRAKRTVIGLLWPKSNHLKAIEPFADLTVGFFAFNAIGFLNTSDQFVVLAVNGIDIIVGQATPLFFDVTGKLFPTSFDLVPIHHRLLFWLTVCSIKGCVALCLIQRNSCNVVPN
jgi:hypothetical protein